MRVLGIGDSIALPRDGVRYEDTWFYRIKELYPGNEFRNIFLRQMTSDQFIQNETFLCYNYLPDIAIIQIGICDSSPRIINVRKFYWLICILFFERINKIDWFWKTIKKIFKRNPKRTFVSLADFKENFENYCQRLIEEKHVRKIIILSIAPVGTPAVKRNPLWNDNINRYNAVLKEVGDKYAEAIFLQPYLNSDDSWFVEDGYHLNSQGHHIVVEALKPVLNEFLK